MVTEVVYSCVLRRLITVIEDTINILSTGWLKNDLNSNYISSHQYLIFMAYYIIFYLYKVYLFSSKKDLKLFTWWLNNNIH